jgi:Zn-finger nucleic acid-binding protein
MNCIQCGAPMMVENDRLYFHCNYCGSNIFPDPNKDGAALLDEISPHSCPMCKTRLVSACYGEIRILSCPACRGNLIDQAKMISILRQISPQAAGSAEPLHPPDRTELRRRLTCPVCHRKMETYPYAGSGDMIIIQGCMHCCLIWLDYGELDKIIHSSSQLHEEVWDKLDEEFRCDAYRSVRPARRVRVSRD